MKKISLPSFFIGAGVGLVVGVLLLGATVHYLIKNAISSGSTQNLPFGSAIDQVRDSLEHVSQEQMQTAVYGTVVTIGGGTLVLEVNRSTGPIQFTFRYDDNTKFVTLTNDSKPVEIPFSSDEILVGEGLNVSTEQPVGSISNQYALKIIK